MTLPELLSLDIEILLLGNLESSDCLLRVLDRVPDLANILDGLVLKILAKLDLEEVLGVVSRR